MKQDERHDLKQLIREVVTEAVPQAVEATLERFGFEVKDATAMQADMSHLRKLRRGSEIIRATAVKTCIGAAVLAGIWVVIEGVKAWIKNGMQH